MCVLGHYDFILSSFHIQLSLLLQPEFYQLHAYFANLLMPFLQFSVSDENRSKESSVIFSYKKR
jgi:hypothetical protein